MSKDPARIDNKFFIQNGNVLPMTAETDYESLLKRARDNLPDNISDHQRFQVPQAEVIYEGKLTILRNFQDICDTLERKNEHLFAYLLKELGTAGNMEGRRVIFKGRLVETRITDRINEYVNMYVVCSECKRPDTHLEKDGRTLVLKCMACGAHRPVRAHKSSN
jgi:translation initiation factor 2 subunit 2